MAQTTYTLPLTPTDRVVEVMVAVAHHMTEWNRQHNAMLVSIVRVGQTVEFTFTNPLPQAELRAIRAEIT